MSRFWIIAGVFLAVSGVFSHQGASAREMDSKQPIDISADTLEVLQEKQQAIFSGNVIAKQGNITMQAARMLVHYRGSDSGKGDVAGAVKGISQIEADGGVFFSSPRETVRGSQAVYHVDREEITMNGDVVLTRDKNILKGTHLTYNLATGRSVLGSGGQSGGANAGGRVRGLFVPNQKGQ